MDNNKQFRRMSNGDVVVVAVAFCSIEQCCLIPSNTFIDIDLGEFQLIVNHAEKKVQDLFEF